MYEFIDLGIADHDAAADGPPILGVEVTDPELAALCALGNIDPQHGPDAGPAQPCAAAAALSHPLPPPGARLATVRPDLDSVCAMALLDMRARGVAIDEAVAERVRRVDRVDSFRMGPWPGRRPLPETAEDILAEGGGADLRAVAAAGTDRRRGLAEKVALAAAWLQTGAPPESYADAAASSAQRLADSLRGGRTKVCPTAFPEVATVVSPEPGALGLGYRLAPVVVALNPDFRFANGKAGRKFTVARYAPRHANLDAAATELARHEPGWGGQAGIKGSPQDRGSELALDMVVAIVGAALPQEPRKVETP